MEENKQEEILKVVLDRLNQEDVWFASKEDKFYADATNLFKLNEYGELEDKSKERLLKEIEDLIGDGATYLIEAVDQWIQDNLIEGTIGYTDTLNMNYTPKEITEEVTAYQDDGIEDLGTEVAEEADKIEESKKLQEYEGSKEKTGLATDIPEELLKDGEWTDKDLEAYCTKYGIELKGKSKRKKKTESEIHYTMVLSLPNCVPCQYTDDYTEEEAKKEYLENEGAGTEYTIDDIEIEYIDEYVTLNESRKIIESKSKEFGKWRVEVSDGENPSASFYDMSQDKTKFPNGQHTGATYRVDTLLGKDGDKSINDMSELRLWNDIPAWTVEEKDLKEIYKWLLEITDSKDNKSGSAAKVYQMKATDENHGKLFMPFGKDTKVSLNDYEEVAEIEVSDDLNVFDALEYIFEVGNTNQEIRDKFPNMRSISMSDIVLLDGRYYYCDTFGWKDISTNLTESKKVTESSSNDLFDKVLGIIEDYNYGGFNIVPSKESNEIAIYDLEEPNDDDMYNFSNDDFVEMGLYEIPEVRVQETNGCIVITFDGKKVEESKYQVTVTSGEDGVYSSSVYDTVDSEEQAIDMVAELQAQGLGAGYEKIEEEETFEVGDRVKIGYISDTNPHNDSLATVKWVHEYKYYPNGNPDEFEMRTQIEVEFDDGSTEMVTANGDYPTLEKVTESEVVSEFNDEENGISAQVVKADNGKYMNYYYTTDKEHWDSNAGPFDTEDEAIAMVQKHRPSTKKVEAAGNDELETFEVRTDLYATISGMNMDDNEYWDEDYANELFSRYPEIEPDEIYNEANKLMKNEDLAEYLPDDLKDIVMSIKLHVEYGELVAVIKATSNLNYEEVKEKLADYLTGQYSDGWGEGFEQRALATEIRFEDSDGIDVNADVYLSPMLRHGNAADIQLVD